MLKSIDWFWFAIGMAFAMFILPLLTQMLGRLKGQAGMKKAA